VNGLHKSRFIDVIIFPDTLGAYYAHLPVFMAHQAVFIIGGRAGWRIDSHKESKHEEYRKTCEELSHILSPKI
jgi:hypothetical protein